MEDLSPMLKKVEIIGLFKGFAVGPGKWMSLFPISYSGTIPFFSAELKLGSYNS